MRVLMMHGDPRDPDRDGQGGGAEALLHDLARGLSARGHVLKWWHGGPVKDAVEDFQPDICQIMTLHCYGGMGEARWLQARGVPSVWFLADYWPFCANRNLLVDYDRSCPAVEGVCSAGCPEGAVPAEYREILRGSYCVTGNPTSAAIFARNGVRIDAVVLPGIDTDLFVPDPAKRSPLPSIYASAAWAAWPTKGMHILKAALRGRPYSANLLTGLPRSAVAEHLKRAHIYVFPSCYEETFGLCLCEAMASGCACIASDVAGAKAQIVPEETGLLVPKRDATALGQAMDRLLQDAPLRERLGRAAREWAARECSLEAMAIRWEAIYQQAILPTIGPGYGSGSRVPRRGSTAASRQASSSAR